MIGGSKQASHFVNHTGIRNTLGDLIKAGSKIDIEKLITGLKKVPLNELDEVLEGIYQLRNVPGVENWSETLPEWEISPKARDGY